MRKMKKRSNPFMDRIKKNKKKGKKSHKKAEKLQSVGQGHLVIKTPS